MKNIFRHARSSNVGTEFMALNEENGKVFLIVSGSDGNTSSIEMSLQILMNFHIALINYLMRKVFSGMYGL